MQKEREREREREEEEERERGRGREGRGGSQMFSYFTNKKTKHWLRAELGQSANKPLSRNL